MVTLTGGISTDAQASAPLQGGVSVSEPADAAPPSSNPVQSCQLPNLLSGLASKAGGTSPSPSGAGGDDLTKWRASKKAAIEKALENQRDMLEKKKNELQKWDDHAKANFKKSFGKTDDKSRKLIQARIDRMLALNKKMTVDNFKPANPSKPGVFAYVYPTDTGHTVYLDKQFDSAGDTGVDSKAGALSHEMSHFDDVGATRDYFKDYNSGNSVYGAADSHKLASDDPDKALNHADSFEYYLEEAP